MKKKRKRKGKLEAQETQWPVPSGVIGSKPPQVRWSPYGDTRSFPGNGQMIVSNPSIKRAMLWTALFVLFLIIITIFELALR